MENITGVALKQVVLKFIPEQVIRDVDLSKLGFDNSDVLEDGGVGLLKKLIEKSTDDIRVYGTEENLSDALHDYRQFTSSHRYFGTDISEEYYMEPEIITNDKQESFICKQDLFNFRLTRSAISIFLKTCEAKLNGCCEFVKYDPEFFDSISVEMQVFGDYMITCHPSKSTIDEIYNEWKSWLPEWTDEQFEPIKSALQAHFKKYPLGTEINEYIFSTIAFKAQLLTLQRVINNHPELFLPATSPIFPIPIRIFGDENESYVMMAEVKKAWDWVFPKNKFNYKDPDGYVEVISVEGVKGDYSDLLPKIEFLNCPMRVPEAKPTPIMTPTGDFCVHITEAFQQVGYHLTLVLKIFQKIKKDKWHRVEKYMMWLGQSLSIEVTKPHLVKLDKLERILQYTTGFFKEFESVPAKSIQTIRKLKYTVGDLKKELRRLELTDVLPDVLNNAQEIHNKMMDAKANLDNSSVFNMPELFNAIGQCQYNCILQMFPKVFFGTDDLFSFGNIYIEPPKKRNPVSKKSVEKVPKNVKTEEIKTPDERSSQSTSDTFPAESIKTETHPEVKLREDSCQNCQKLMNQIEEIMFNDKEEVASYRAMLEEYTSAGKQQEEQIRRQSTALVNSNKEIDILKSKLSKYEDNEEKLKETNKKLMETKNQLTKRVTNLESQVKNEKQKIHKIEQESEQQRIDFNRKFSVLQSEYDKEVMENKPIQEEYTKKIKNLETQLQLTTDSKSELSDRIIQLETELAAKNSEIEITIEHFTLNISELQEQLKRTTDATQLEVQLAQKSSEIEKLNKRLQESQKALQIEDLKKKNLENRMASYRTDIGELQNMKRELTIKNSQLESLLTRAPNTERGAIDPELTDLKKAYQELQSTNDRQTGQIENQSLMIKAFFDQFGQVKKSYSSSSTQTTQSDSIDSECLICLIEMTPNEKTMKCESCRKVLHLECASEWLKRHRSCPHCRRELLDPNEFPALG